MQSPAPSASRRRFLATSTAAAGSFAVLRAPARAAQFEFRCASGLSNDHPNSINMKKMWAAIEGESGGRLSVKFFPDGSLGGQSGQPSQVRLGATHFAVMAPGTLSAVVPSVDISNLGFAFRNASEALRVLDGPLGTYLRDDATTKGFHVMKSVWDSGMAIISSSTHPIRTPDDLHGFRVDVNTSKILSGLFSALGAQPTYVTNAEQYTALQTKFIDGDGAPLLTIETARYYEVQKYISLTNHAWSGHWLVANADVWKSLPNDLQELVERKNTQYCAAERNDTRGLNVSVTQRLIGHGLIINQVDQAPFRARLKGYYDGWESTFGATQWGLLQTALGRKLG